MPKLLALDLSGEVGWALFNGIDPPKFGTVKVNQYRDFTFRMFKFQQWLEDHFVRYPWDAMAWERPILMPTDTPQKVAILYGLPGVAGAFAGKHQMRWDSVSVDEVKMAVCGDLWKDNDVDQKRKKMDKADMVRFAQQRLGFDVTTHHEADAAGVGMVAWESLNLG